MNETNTPETNASPEDHREATNLCKAERPLSKAQEKIRTTKIRTLNDTLRTTFLGGQVVMTRGVADLPTQRRAEIVQKVQNFSNFSKDNDPYGEHDFGIIEAGGETVYWKIDYYDKTLEYGSEDPSDPQITSRVLTILLREEY